MRTVSYKFRSYELANGLRVVLAPDDRDTDVAVNISIDAGSGVENTEQAGLARLLQQIVLQNLQQSKDGEHIAADGERLKPFEGVVNQERASYFAECTAGQLDFVLALFASQMYVPDMTQTYVDEQKLVMLTECRRLDDRSFGRIQDALLQLIYKDAAHKYGAICSRPDLHHLSLEQTEAFLRAYYVPVNAVIAIVGNFQPNDARRIVAKHFGPMSGQRMSSRVGLSGQPLSLGERKVINSVQAKATTYLSAYLTVPSNHPDWYAMNILADTIGQGDTSRLYTALVMKHLAASVPEGMDESRGRSLFRIGAVLLSGVEVEMVEALIDAEIARIQQDGVSSEEIEKARSQEQAYYAEQLDTPAGRASLLARSTLYYDEPNRINTELRYILAVTAQDVQRVAQKYLAKTNRAVVILQPDTLPE
jgi:predicted Zn-dependent peptidase